MTEGTDKYPPGTTGPAQFAETLRQTDGRLRALESSSGRGMQPVIFDPATGAEIVRLGLLPDLSYGLIIYSPSGQTVFRVSNDGTFRPRLAIPLFANASADVGDGGTKFRPGTTLGAYTELWRGDFWSVGDQVSYDLGVFPNAGNMDWRVYCYEAGGGTPTVVVGPTTETSNQQRAGTFTIPAACLVAGSDPVGRSMTIRVEAKKNSGATTVDVSVNAACINY